MNRGAQLEAWQDTAPRRRCHGESYDDLGNIHSTGKAGGAHAAVRSAGHLGSWGYGPLSEQPVVKRKVFGVPAITRWKLSIWSMLMGESSFHAESLQTKKQALQDAFHKAAAKQDKSAAAVKGPGRPVHAAGPSWRPTGRVFGCGSWELHDWRPRMWQ